MINVLDDLVVFVGLMLAGFILGRIMELASKKLEEKEFLGGTLYSFIVETLYFAALFSIPMSGNVPIFILVAGLLLYSLYGKFGTERLKPGKPEDEVHTKWFTGYP